MLLTDQICSCSCSYAASIAPGAALYAALQPDGSLLATGYESGHVCVWNPEGELLASLKASDTSVICLGFSVSGLRLAAACADGHVIVWNVHPPRSSSSTAVAAAGASVVAGAAADGPVKSDPTAPAPAAGRGMSWQRHQGDAEEQSEGDGWSFVPALSYSHASECCSRAFCLLFWPAVRH